MADENQENEQQKASQPQEKKIEFEPMRIRDNPMVDNVFGEAGTFVNEFIEAMDNEFLYRSMGTSPDKTFLVTGRPGLGKTLGVEALINEANRGPLEESKQKKKSQRANLIGFKYDIGRYGSKYINEGSTIMQGFFDVVLAHAEYGFKTVAIFDEADVLFGKRGARLNASKEDEKVLDTIMKNLQRVHDTDNAYAVIMSNFPEAFDEASIRAGRIDKKYVFRMPDYNDRQMAYQAAIGEINNRAIHSVIRGYDTAALAEISEGFSYADIVESVNAAVKQKVKEVSQNKTNKIIPAMFIKQNRLLSSVENHKKSFVSTEKKKQRIGFTDK